MPIGPSGERLPYPGEPGARAAAVGNGSRVGQAMARSGPLPRGDQRQNGGPPDEVAQLLALRDQIDQRLTELMGGGVTQSGIGTPAGMPAGPPPNGGMPPAGLLGAGPY
jgi:hypothetical protein